MMFLLCMCVRELAQEVQNTKQQASLYIHDMNWAGAAEATASKTRRERKDHARVG